MGQKNNLCPVLKVHGERIERVETEKYLGDKISSDCKSINKTNINERKSKGLGIVAQIMTLLNTMCIGGQYYFKAAMLLRESLLVNGILFNSEIWYDISEHEMRELEEVDECFLRRILNAHLKTPIEALYLELGSTPLRYIIKSRRINYLHYLTKLKKDELLSRFFQAQMKSPVQGDWINTVVEDLKHVNLNLTIKDIPLKSKLKFKKEVKVKIVNTAFNYLKQKSQVHSKMDNLRYKKLSLQKYLSSDLLSKRESQKLFMFRTRMAQFAKNFPNGTDNFECPICKKENTIDNEAHSLNCEVILKQVPNAANQNVGYIWETI